ncbi:MAG: acyltransferase family protein [Rhizomicrobium sp.]
MESVNQNRAEAAGGRYRADIDGLRAVAVLPVIFYHFGVPPFSGGFVGVDVFFVISGFLITALIHAEMGDGRFSILNFYERRVRRILPALYAVVAFTLAGATLVLFPDALVAYAKSLVATAGFVSNFQFWSETSYFGVIAAQKPLLHTWSLAVEEQYYVVFPLLLLLLRRSRRLLIWLLALLVLSLAASIWAVAAAPVSAFYLLPFRFWELLLGGVLAVGRFPAPGNAVARNAIAALGLALIGWGVFALTGTSPFPGLNAVPSCLGTALLIYAGTGEATLVNAALATRGPVFVGLISYSLYLWHWPLLVFAKYAAPMGALNPLATVLLIALSFALAILSWRFVERPFRGRNGLLSRNRLFALAATMIAVFAAAGAILWIGKGLPQRYSPPVRAILAVEEAPKGSEIRCFSRSPRAVAAGNLCKVGDAAAPPTFLVWGDSHSQALLPAIAAAAVQKHRAGLFAGHGYCAPLDGVTRLDVRRCTPFNAAVMRLAMRPTITEVILVARWAPDAGASPIGPDDRGAIALTDAQSKSQDARNTYEVFSRGLERAVRKLRGAGKKVVIVASVPENRVSVPEEMAKMRIAGRHWPIEISTADFLARQSAVFAEFRKLQVQYGVVMVYPHTVLCRNGVCAVEKDGAPLYRDAHHLSAAGAGLLVGLLVPVL